MELPRSRRNVKHCKLNDGSEFEFSQSRYNQFHIGVEGTHERERSRPPSRGSRRYGECHYYSPHTRECNNFGQDFYRQEHPSNNNQEKITTLKGFIMEMISTPHLMNLFNHQEMDTVIIMRINH